MILSLDIEAARLDSVAGYSMVCGCLNLGSANHSCRSCDENEAVHSSHSGANLDVLTLLPSLIAGYSHFT